MNQLESICKSCRHMPLHALSGDSGGEVKVVAGGVGSSDGDGGDGKECACVLATLSP